MSPQTLSVSFVCTGNICRSPIAEVVLRDLLDEAGLGDRIRIDSAGTGSWHLGDPPDPRALDVLAAHDHDGTSLRARQFSSEDFDQLDLVLALDRGHERALRRAARGPEDVQKVRLLRSFDPTSAGLGELEVDDPYYGGPADFQRTYDEVRAACEHLAEHLAERLDAPADRA